MKYIYLTIILIAFLSFRLSAQCESKHCHYYYDENLKKNIYTMVDVKSMLDNEKFILSYIVCNLRISEDDELQFTFNFSCIIDDAGKILEAKILKKEESEYTSIEKKLIKLLFDMDKWKPALCNDKPVPFLYKLPLHLDYRQFQF